MKECTQEGSFRYNYFFFGADDDYIQAIYGDLIKHTNVHFHPYGVGSRNPILRALFKIHWSAKINARVRLPLKRIWFRKMCSYDFGNENPTCYIFLGGQYVAANKKLQAYIYDRNPQNRIVIQYEDLISKKKYRDFESVRNSADYLVTYDAAEAEKYQIHLFDAQIYSPIEKVTEPTEFDYDVYFLGFAKDRLNTIHLAYQRLTDAGLRCCFIICGTKPEDRLEGKGLHYSEPISYAKNISNLQRSRCVLELMQGGSNAITLRTQEAICYRRKLLTNHTAITEQTWFDPAYISAFSKPEEIDTEFAALRINYSAFDTAPDLSPIRYLSFLESLMEGTECSL